MIDLEKFFSKDGGMWRHDGKLIATDRSIAIEIDDDGRELLEGDISALPGSIFGLMANKTGEWCAFSAEIPDDIPTCSSCDGTGRITECTACDGDGGDECACCGQSKNCEDCGGAGFHPGGNEVCHACNGSGTQARTVAAKVSGGTLSAHYAQLLADLPQPVEIEPMNDFRAFRFPGGRGVVSGFRT